MIKLKYILIILLFQIISTVYSENNKAMIMPFQNNSITDENSFIKDIISDSIKNNLLINPILIIEENKNNIPINSNAVEYALENDIDFIFSGFYFENDNKIIITYKIIDTFSNKLLFLVEKKGESKSKIFDLLNQTSKEILDDLSKVLKIHNDAEKLILKNKLIQEKKIKNNEWIPFLFIKSGINYSGLKIFNNYSDPSLIPYFNNNSDKNTYENFISPSLDFEIYGKNDSNFVGFGLNALAPINLNIPNFMQYSRIVMSVNYGFKNDFFFLWGLYANSISFSKYSVNADSRNKVTVNYFGFGLNFSFRYLPEKYPFFVETGLYLQLPSRPILSNNMNPINSILTDYSMIDNKSWFFPVSFDLGFGVFLNKNVGLFINGYFYFLSVDYNTNLYNSNMDIGTSYDKNNNLGIDFSFGYNIIFGVTVKTIVK